MSRCVGIDLGTTNCCVAVLEGGLPIVIPNSEGGRTTPSIVAFSKNGEVLIGEVAKRQSMTNINRTVLSVKRHIGSDWFINLDNKKLSPTEVSSLLLKKIKKDTEAYLGEDINDAVITVPAYFSDAQRQMTKLAGELAGFTVLRIINEPTAAALAYGLNKIDTEQNILVFDLGGGTFDVSLLTSGGGVLEVLATSGDNYLGGDDWDQLLVKHLIEEFLLKHGINLSKDQLALQRIKESAENAKIELSSTLQTKIILPYISLSSDGQPLSLESLITRTQFERLTAPLLERCRGPFQAVLRDANLPVEKIDSIVLVGGSTRMPAILELVKQITGGLISATEVNPDEVVAMGAALQSGIIKGSVKDILLLDVTPLSLGIETKGGVMTNIIDRNTTIPTRRSEIFSTAEDDQETVRVKVYQGERKLVQYNKPLGTFELTGLKPALRGVPQIEVSFDIDANGIISVAARDIVTGEAHSMQISDRVYADIKDVGKIVSDAALYEVDDTQRKAEIEDYNSADRLAYHTRQFLWEHGDGLSADLQKVKEETEVALLSLNNALLGKNITTIRTAADVLKSTSHILGIAFYNSKK
jgi:molecular chaperone DnaK